MFLENAGHLVQLDVPFNEAIYRTIGRVVDKLQERFIYPNQSIADVGGSNVVAEHDHSCLKLLQKKRAGGGFRGNGRIVDIAFDQTWFMVARIKDRVVKEEDLHDARITMRLGTLSFFLSET